MVYPLDNKESKLPKARDVDVNRVNTAPTTTKKPKPFKKPKKIKKTK